LKGNLAVIMTVYNEELGFIKLAVESTLEALEGFSLSKLFIFVDNKSDNLKQGVFDYLSSLNSKHSNLVVYFSNGNRGLALSLNYLVKEYCQKFDFIARMDADDICHKERFNLQYNEILSTGFDIVGSDAIKINESGDKIGIIKNQTFPKLYYGNEMVHPSMMFTKEAFDKLNGYRNYSAAQDYDYLCRARALNLKIKNISEALVSYRIRQGAIGQSRKKIQVMYKVAISSSFRRKKILDEELSLDFSSYKFFDYIESKRNESKIIYRILTLFSSLHIKNYYLNIAKRFI
jgi:cellulose synthase/poly-beta-1,6-N-acetylglucosamine synthase-like glycosyltransferase